MFGRRWTQDQKEWLVENYQNFDTVKQVADEFNKAFNESRTSGQISDIATKRLGLKRNKNIGTYGKREKEELPIGTVRKSAVGTYVKVKESGNKNITGYQKPYWIPLQEKIYTDAYGEIPEGYYICFLNGNNEDFSLDNLYPINRAISVCMAQGKYWTDSKIHTLTAIKYWELFYARKQFRKGKTHVKKVREL